MLQATCPMSILSVLHTIPAMLMLLVKCVANTTPQLQLHYYLLLLSQQQSC